MISYQTETPLSPTRMRYRPTREIRIARNGALLAAMAPRYESLEEYVSQFASPLSMLRGVGLWSFYDPITPECTLLVQCEPEEHCARCREALRNCECRF